MFGWEFGRRKPLGIPAVAARSWVAIVALFGVVSTAQIARASDAFSGIDEGLARAEAEARAAQPLTPEAADRWRIQRHLARVERYLRLKDTSHLVPSQRALREQSLDALHGYWMAGVFPRNANHPGELRPYFIDEGDRACAVAFLLQAAGDGELARAVDRGFHNAYVQEMNDPRLAIWAARAGFEVSDLALIQPAYCKCGEPDGDGGASGAQPYDPMCGVDGLTYWNECATGLCGGVEIAHSGACDHDPLCELCGTGERLAVVSECYEGEIPYGVCQMEGGEDVVPVRQALAEKWLELQDSGCPEDASYDVDDGLGWRTASGPGGAATEDWDCTASGATGGAGGAGGQGAASGDGGDGGDGGGRVEGGASGEAGAGARSGSGGGPTRKRDDDGGCSLTWRSVGSPWGWLALLTAPWLLRARRRRGRRSGAAT